MTYFEIRKAIADCVIECYAKQDFSNCTKLKDLLKKLKSFNTEEAKMLYEGYKDSLYRIVNNIPDKFGQTYQQCVDANKNFQYKFKVGDIIKPKDDYFDKTTYKVVGCSVRETMPYDFDFVYQPTYSLVNEDGSAIKNGSGVYVAETQRIERDYELEKAHDNKKNADFSIDTNNTTYYF